MNVFSQGLCLIRKDLFLFFQYCGWSLTDSCRVGNGICRNEKWTDVEIRIRRVGLQVRWADCYWVPVLELLMIDSGFPSQERGFSRRPFCSKKFWENQWPTMDGRTDHWTTRNDTMTNITIHHFHYYNIHSLKPAPVQQRFIQHW